MKKILLSLLLAGGVQNSFAMQAGGDAAQGGAAGSASADTADDNLSSVNKALFDAARSGDLVAVRAQLANGTNVNAQNAKGATALMCAANNGHVEVVRQLIAGGADFNAQNTVGVTALMIAAYHGHVGVVQALLYAGADVNARKSGDATALMIAVEWGHVGVVQALIAEGANVNAQNIFGATALMAAAKNGHVDFLQALLHAGANVNAQNAQGGTALMCAASKGHVDVVQVLLHAGADVDVKCNAHKTALDYASGKPEIIALLQAHKASQAAQAASAQPVPSKAAAAKGKGKAAAVGGVASAGGGAASQPAVNPKLCAEVAAKILKDAKVQTDELVQILPSGGQKRLASSLGSAFSRPKPTVVPTGAASTTTAEQPSCEIMRPIARRPQGYDLPSMQHAMTWSQPIFGLVGTQPAMAMPVAQQIPLQNLITQASSNVSGLFGLIELLNSSAHDDNFDAHQAEALFTFMGFDATVFASYAYAPITGSQLAEILLNNIRAILGDIDPNGSFTPTQTSWIQALNQRFALYAQHFGN